MRTLDEKFNALVTYNAPGQEGRQENGDLRASMRGEKFDGIPVDFSHGDIDAFPLIPGASGAWKDGFDLGGQQAYTEYRGASQVREIVAGCLEKFTGRPVSASRELIITPGTLGHCFWLLVRQLQ